MIFIFITQKSLQKRGLTDYRDLQKIKCTPLDFYANKMLLYYCKGVQKLKSQRPYVGFTFNLYY